MKTRGDGIRLLRSLLNDRADEFKGVFASNPEMREVFTAAREVLEAPDAATVRADIVAMLERRAAVNTRVANNPETTPRNRDFADAAATCARSWAGTIRDGHEKESS